MTSKPKSTIMVNSVLLDMMPYSCHSTISPDRLKHKMVRHGNGNEGNVEWEFKNSTSCMYDRKAKDDRCRDCLHPNGFVVAS